MKTEYEPFLFEQPVIWHVVFHPERKWWDRRFSHVSLAGLAEGNTWIHLDLHSRGLSLGSIFRHDEVQDYLSYLLAYHVVYRFGVVEVQRPVFGRPMTCVSFVKHALGIKSRALRPSGLLKSLIRENSGVLLNETAKASSGISGAEGSAQDCGA